MTAGLEAVSDGGGMPDEALRCLIDAVIDPVILGLPVLDSAGELTDLVCAVANSAAGLALARSTDELIGSSARQVLAPREADRLVRLCSEALRVHATVERADRPSVHDGDSRWFDVRVAPSAAGLFVTWRDVSDRHAVLERLAGSEQMLRILAENASDLLYFADAQGRASWVAPTVTRTLGWRVQDLVGTDVFDLVHPDDREVVATLHESVVSASAVIALHSDGTHPLVARMRKADGDYRWMSITATRVREPGDEHGVVVGMRDIDELVASQALAERGQRDDLTGLVNRPSLLERMDKLLSEGRRKGDQHAVLFCDVDHFKEINDTYGHAVGDEVLRTIASRIRANVRNEDLVARLGGDEFVVLLHGVRGTADAEAAAEKIRMAMGEALVVDGINVARSFSIGVAMVGPDTTPDRVLREADAALYQAKEAGRDRTVTHSARLLAG